MKTILFLATMLLVFGCSQQTKTDSTTPSQTTETKKPVISSLSQLAASTDLNCGMKFTSAEDVKDTMTYNGKLYGFCSKECKESFAADPKKFIK